MPGPEPPERIFKSGWLPIRLDCGGAVGAQLFGVMRGHDHDAFQAEDSTPHPEEARSAVSKDEARARQRPHRMVRDAALRAAPHHEDRMPVIAVNRRVGRRPGRATREPGPRSALH